MRAGQKDSQIDTVVVIVLNVEPFFIRENGNFQVLSGFSQLPYALVNCTP